MSNSTFINNIFSELVNYLDNIKVPLEFLRERSLNDEEIDMLSQHRNVLEEIKKKIGSYKEDVESTIQDIDSILPPANANTNAFKKSLLVTQDLQYQTVPVKSLAEIVPSNIQFGSGVAVAATIRDQHQGDIIQTGRQLDFRIGGKGFFVVNYPDGVQKFTRDGAFLLSPEGQIVTKEGYIVSPGINVPDNYSYEKIECYMQGVRDYIKYIKKDIINIIISLYKWNKLVTVIIIK
jgi:hypothetical protein